MKILRRVVSAALATIMVFSCICVFAAEDNSAVLSSNIDTIQLSASGSIEIGDYVVMGNYLGEDILWRCVDKDENGPLMLSDKILCIKPFDAKGSNTSGSHGRDYSGYYRQRYGSNYWGDSNMRCWLNSTASAGKVNWSCSNPPDEVHVLDGYNEYDQEAGFLTNFTSAERFAIKTVTQKQLLYGYEYSSSCNNNYHRYRSSISDILQNYDTAYSENTTDKMFLLDVKQLYNVYQNSDILGSDYYKAKCTAAAVADSEYSCSYISESNYGYYWLRSPYASNGSDDVRCVYPSGTVHYDCAYYNNTAVGACGPLSI